VTPGGGGTLQVFLQYTNLICEYMQSLGWQVSNTSSHGPLAGGAGATGAGGLVGGLVGGLGACLAASLILANLFVKSVLATDLSIFRLLLLLSILDTASLLLILSTSLADTWTKQREMRARQPMRILVFILPRADSQN